MALLIVLCGWRTPADPLDHWTLRNAGNPTNDYYITAVVHGNGRFVATAGAGDAGMILASADGRNWAQVLGGWENFVMEQRDVIFNDGRFVTVTWGGSIWTSSNGLHWVHSGNSMSADFTAVTYGGGRYVAVGTGWDVIWYSTNALEWLPAYNPFLGPRMEVDLYDVAYGNGLFVAVGDTNWQALIQTSPDGQSWTRRDAGFTNGSVDRVVYGNGRFVATASVATNGAPHVQGILTSSNGVDWVRQPFLLPGVRIGAYFTGSLEFHNGTFVLLGYRDESPSRAVNVLYVSTNGVDWQSRSLNLGGAGPTNFLRGLGFGDNTIVIGGDRRTIIQSEPLLQLQQSEPGVLSVTGLRERTYAIEAAENLALGTSAWQQVATMTLSNEPSLWRDPAAIQRARFYRAVWLP